MSAQYEEKGTRSYYVDLKDYDLVKKFFDLIGFNISKSLSSKISDIAWILREYGFDENMNYEKNELLAIMEKYLEYQEKNIKMAKDKITLLKVLDIDNII